MGWWDVEGPWGNQNVACATESRDVPRRCGQGEAFGMGAACTDPCTDPGVCPSPGASVLIPTAGFVPGKAQAGQSLVSLMHTGLLVAEAAAVGPAES